MRAGNRKQTLVYRGIKTTPENFVFKEHYARSGISLDDSFLYLFNLLIKYFDL